MYETYETYEDESNEQFEWGESEWSGESEQETLESELAQELLEINTEAELNQFLGKLAKGVMKGASSFMKSGVGKALGGVLKNVAKTALPVVGGALGSLVLPGVGTAIGSKLGSMAGGLLEAEEAERMDESEAQFEAAQRYVRFARAAYRNAARAPRGVPPRAVVRAASVSAARAHAPSLLRPTPPRRRRRPGRRQGGGRRVWYYEPQPWEPPDDPGDSWAGPSVDDGATDADAPEDEAGEAVAEHNRPHRGTWVRRGGRIVLLGI